MFPFSNFPRFVPVYVFIYVYVCAECTVHTYSRYNIRTKVTICGICTHGEEFDATHYYLYLEIGSYAAVLYFISFGWVRVGAATRAEARVANPVTVILDFSYYDFAHFLLFSLHIFRLKFPPVTVWEGFQKF